MNAERAFKSIGFNGSGVPFENMIKALQMMSWLNTTADTERLDAAKWVKKNRKAYAAFCSVKRDQKFSMRSN